MRGASYIGGKNREQERQIQKVQEIKHLNRTVKVGMELYWKFNSKKQKKCTERLRKIEMTTEYACSLGYQSESTCICVT